MKKVILLFILFISIINVNAKSYTLQEVIPVNEESNLCTEVFDYKNFYYDASVTQANSESSNFIRFENVENLGVDTHRLSISVGLFNDDKENIAVYNYCDTKELKHGEKSNFDVQITNELLQNNKVSDIKYFAVMSDNLGCKNGIDFSYKGKKAEFIEFDDGYKKENMIIRYFVYLVIIVIVTLILKFIFDITINKNGKISKKILGEEVVDNRSNEEIKKQYYDNLEIEKNKNKKEEKKEDIKDLSQEKGKTDLHNFYK